MTRPIAAQPLTHDQPWRDHVDDLVAQAPPLCPDQRHRLAALLRPDPAPAEPVRQAA